MVREPPEIHSTIDSAVDRVQFAVDLFLQFNPQKAGSVIDRQWSRETHQPWVIVVESRVLLQGTDRVQLLARCHTIYSGDGIPKKNGEKPGEARGDKCK